VTDDTTQATLPLTGIRVLEFGGYISLPYATSLLNSLGADVVKVERPITGDDFRRGVGVESFFFRQYNAGKRSLSLDLKRPEGIEVVKDLIPRFDVVVENMRPGKMQSLGLGRADCLKLRSDLIYASITGFGSGGPLALQPAYDTIGQAYGALMSVLSNAGSAQLSGAALADLITGFAAVTGILASLIAREYTGKPQYVETSLMEAVSVLTIDAMTQYFDSGHQEPTRQSRHPQAQNFVVKTAAGDDLVMHLSSSSKFWLSFLDVIERVDLADDPRFTTYPDRCQNYFELADIVVPEFLRKTSDEWVALLAKHDVPYAPVATMSEYIHNPQVEWLELVEPEENGLSLLRPPWSFEGRRPRRNSHVAAVGEHSREIALEVYEKEAVERLITDGTLFVS
jgi:crotonobetainyl-CoA:carnitine CoA-transferase CaiB-like acyl-CoA transferase